MHFVPVNLSTHAHAGFYRISAKITNNVACKTTTKFAGLEWTYFMHISASTVQCSKPLHATGTSPQNRRHPPPPVDEAPSQSQVDEPSTRRRLRSMLPLTRHLNTFCSIPSTI